MLATLGLLSTLGLGLAKPVPFDHLSLYRELRRSDRARISIWLDRTSPYTRGDRARVYVTAEQDAYLTVLRIDTDGRVRVLFPQEPWDDNYVPGGRTFEVEDRGGERAFRVDDAPGAGYVFAIASEERFDYSSILTQREHWDYRSIADGQVRGDPYVAVTDLAERIVPSEGEYDYDLAQYDVERHYDYPRFVCYDCHAYAPYYSWNPYAHSCVRFRVVIYDDPYYYPYRYYGGRRVVITRPRRPQPRYVFVDNNGGRDYVTRIPNRPRRADGTVDRPTDGTTADPMRPRRGEDVGGRGTIPAPGNGGRRIVRDPQTRPTEPRQEPQARQPERRRTENGESIKPQPPAPETRRRNEQDAPAGLRPQPRPPQDQPRTEPRREEEPRSKQPDRRPESRPEPQRPPETQREPETRREPERRPEPRAEPRREPEQRQPETRREPEQRQPETRREPERQPSGGSSNPELRRRRG